MDDVAAVSSTARPRYLTTKRVLQLIAVVLVVVANVVLLLVPTYSSASATSSGDSSQVTSTTAPVETMQTMLQVVGPRLLVVLAIPLAAALLPLWARGRAWIVLSIVSAALLWVFVLLGALSVGLFFLPAALVAVVAACVPSEARLMSAIDPDTPADSP